jgi:gluconate 2-dehydrogenase gamma chain
MRKRRRTLAIDRDRGKMPVGAIDRRDLLRGGILAAAALAPQPAGAAPPEPGSGGPEVPAARDDALLTLTADEAAFVHAAVERLIPADGLGPSAAQAGVVVFIDRQLAGAWGSGARLYRAGPFQQGKPEQGYQLPLTPREFFAAGIGAVDRWVRAAQGKRFDRLDAAARDAVLQALERGDADLGTVSARAFFEALLTITVEGYFADPVYGGNRDKVGWKLVGYPGLPATYAQAVRAYRNRPYIAVPRSIEDFL